MKKVENGTTAYYLRSSMLRGQVVAESNSSGAWTRGYVYLGGQMIAVQAGGVNWVHQDPMTKSQRVTDHLGSVISIVDLDPWGGETWRSSNQAFQPHRFTSYERDANGGHEAMMRRYESYWNRFAQPDPYDGSYALTNPQSFNRYAYTQNDPVNFVDPTGLDWSCPPDHDDVIVICTWAPRWSPGSGSGGLHGPLLDTDAGVGAGGAGNPAPVVGFSRTDKWYGYNNRDFQKWFHRCYKEKGDPDASKQELAEAYAEWVRRGSPKGGNCYGGGGGEPGRVPVGEPSRRQQTDWRKIFNGRHWPLVPSPEEIQAAQALGAAGAVALAIYIIYTASTTPVVGVP